MVRILERHRLRPVPIDLDEVSLVPVPEAVERGLTPRTRAMLVAHLFGSRVDLDHLVEIARRERLLLIEDCAQASSFTLHRLIALDALAALRPNIRPRITRQSWRLGVVPDPESDPDPALLRPIHPLAPDTWTQAREAVEHEWAVTVDDLVRRRLTVAVRGLATETACAELAGLLRSAGFKEAKLAGARAADSGRVLSIT